MNSLFRLFAFLAPSLPTAMAMAGAGTGLLLMFGGFVITRTNLQDYALGAYISHLFLGLFELSLLTNLVRRIMTPLCVVQTDRSAWVTSMKVRILDDAVCTRLCHGSLPLRLSQLRLSE